MELILKRAGLSRIISGSEERPRPPSEPSSSATANSSRNTRSSGSVDNVASGVAHEAALEEAYNAADTQYQNRYD